MHVEQPQVVRPAATPPGATVMRELAKYQAYFPSRSSASPIDQRRHAPRPAGILPLRFRRQPIARQAQSVGLHLHPVRVLPLLVRLVAPLLLSDALLLAQPVAVSRRVVPMTMFTGQSSVGAYCLKYRWSLRKRRNSATVTSRAARAKRRSTRTFTRLSRFLRLELPGRHDHKRLPLAVDVPLPLRPPPSPSPALGRSPRPSPAAPTAAAASPPPRGSPGRDRPGIAPATAAPGPPARPAATDPRRTPPGQQQRPPDRHVRLPSGLKRSITTSALDAARPQAVDQVAPQGRVGAMTQQRPRPSPTAPAPPGPPPRWPAAAPGPAALPPACGLLSSASTASRRAKAFGAPSA